jgi:hypothetical protein
MANYLFPIPSDSQVYLQATQLTKPYRNFRFGYNFSATSSGLVGWGKVLSNQPTTVDGRRSIARYRKQKQQTLKKNTFSKSTNY